MPAAGQRSSKLVLVTVMSARIASKTGTDGWDTAEPQDQEKRTAEGLGALLQLVPETAAAGAMLKTLAQLAPVREPGADAAYPDPLVEVTFNWPVATEEARSPLVVNSTSPAWNYAFYVRLDSLRDSGLDIAVFDDDPERSTWIGGVNLPRAELEAVASSGSVANLKLADGPLEELLVRVEPVIPAASSMVRRVHLDLSTGMVATDIRVPRGALLSVRTTGDGVLGKVSCADEVTPAGLPDGECKHFNLGASTTTLDAPHGSALAFIGVAPSLEAISLVSDSGESDQCVRFVAPQSGWVVFAVNDRDLGNNRGAFDFELEVEPAPEALPESNTVFPCEEGAL